VAELASNLNDKINGGDQKDVMQNDYTHLYDGNANPNWSAGGCYHSATSPAWVEVHFDASYYFTTLSILNRGDCCSDRANGLVFKVCEGSGGDSCTICGSIGIAPNGQWLSVQCPVETEGNVVRFELEDNVINLCEVSIHGSTSPIDGSSNSGSDLEPIDSNNYSDCDHDCDDYHRHCDDLQSDSALDEEGEEFFQGHERSCDDAYISSRCPRSCGLCVACGETIDERLDDVVERLNDMI
jgi:hypothetical protein